MRMLRYPHIFTAWQPDIFYLCTQVKDREAGGGIILYQITHPFIHSPGVTQLLVVSADQVSSAVPSVRLLIVVKKQHFTVVQHL